MRGNNSTSIAPSEQVVGVSGLVPWLLDSSRLQVAGLVLLATWLRVWRLGDKGLWYDEAATALMSRASVGDIIQFHWHAPFEHPPLWALFMHMWSEIFGQSEVALRMPSALAGALAVPLLWKILELAWPKDRTAHLIAVGLVTLSPLLTLYGQEARMYSIVMLLALASVYCGMRMIVPLDAKSPIAFVLINWAMLGFHYYSMLLILVEAIFFIAVAARRHSVGRTLVALGLSMLPLILWARYAPGFQVTLGSVLGGAVHSDSQIGVFLDRLWREITFGSVRWLPRQSVAGYLCLPPFVFGVLWAVGHRPNHPSGRWTITSISWNWFFLMIVAVPILVSLPFANSVPTRYLLFVVPFFYVVLALGLKELRRTATYLRVAGILCATLVALGGLVYYYGFYQKSDYRDMAAYLAQHANPADAVLLEAPRQFLLARYYMGTGYSISPMPPVTLSDYWPVTAPPVVPDAVDDLLRSLVAHHNDLWLVLAGEDEVDASEFVQSYLTAISFPRECDNWLDVRLCHFTSPDFVPAQLTVPLDLVWGGDMRLRGADISLSGHDASSGADDLLCVLKWEALDRPGDDYTITLRLLDHTGRVEGQNDSMPIGPLLPPTTWGPGDEKPGYMSLSLPEALAPGLHDVVLGLYVPAAPELVPFLDAEGGESTVLGLATIAVGEDGAMELLRFNSGSTVEN